MSGRHELHDALATQLILLPLRSPRPSRAQAESPARGGLPRTRQRRGRHTDVGAERSASSGVGDLEDALAHDSLVLVQEQLPRPLAGMASYACAVVRLCLAPTCRRRVVKSG
jgi:hypothetical protein